ncbi:MAG: DUF4162 domain-containing protein, partial [Candidatus Micrarchaeota archaeon]
ADKLCQRIAIMDRGRIIAEGTAEALKHNHGGGRVIKIETDKPTQKLAEQIKEHVGASKVVVDAHEIQLFFDNAQKAALHKVSSFLSAKGVHVKDLRISEPSLEDVFINLTKKDVRD